MLEQIDCTIMLAGSTDTNLKTKAVTLCSHDKYGLEKKSCLAMGQHDLWQGGSRPDKAAHEPDGWRDSRIRDL